MIRCSYNNHYPLFSSSTNPPTVGKGPLRAHYEKIIEEKNFKYVEIVTMWLASEDYPMLLGEWVRYKQL